MSTTFCVLDQALVTGLENIIDEQVIREHELELEVRYLRDRLDRVSRHKYGCLTNEALLLRLEDELIPPEVCIYFSINNAHEYSAPEERIRSVVGRGQFIGHCGQDEFACFTTVAETAKITSQILEDLYDSGFTATVVQWHWSSQLDDLDHLSDVLNANRERGVEVVRL